MVGVGGGGRGCVHTCTSNFRVVGEHGKRVDVLSTSKLFSHSHVN